MALAEKQSRRLRKINKKMRRQYNRTNFPLCEVLYPDCIVYCFKQYAIYLPVAQLDNATDSDSEERGFESLRAGQTKKSLDVNQAIFLFCSLKRTFNDVSKCRI